MKYTYIYNSRNINQNSYMNLITAYPCDLTCTVNNEINRISVITPIMKSVVASTAYNYL